MAQQNHLRDIYLDLQDLEKAGNLEAMGGGQGGAYLLRDEDGAPRFIVKPNDEDILCLNNRKFFASPFSSNVKRVRNDIPTYESAQNEGLSYQIAHLTGLTSIAPKTVMVILKNENFHSITDQSVAQFREFEKLGKNGLIRADEKVKLCSAQEFIPNSEDLNEYMKTHNNFQFNQEDFEKANIFTWLTGDEDGHQGNYRVYDDGLGQGIRLRKIDNGLIGGSQGGPIVNGLVEFGQINLPLSAQGREIIRNIPLDAIVQQMGIFNKSKASIQALENRIKMIQALVAENENITLKQLNQAVKNYYMDR